MVPETPAILLEFLLKMLHIQRSAQEGCPLRVSEEILRDQALFRKDEHPIVIQTEYILEIMTFTL